jgi:hypothetical protein
MVIVKDMVRASILVAAIILGTYFVFAQTWTEPTANPPGNNRPAPLTLDADGNLAIPANLFVAGNTIRLGGANLKIFKDYFNGSEDIYTYLGIVWYTTTDTCHGHVNAAYSCSISESRQCYDVWDCAPNCGWGYRYYRSITCKAAFTPKLIGETGIE